jgi:ribosomal protein L13E
MELYHLVWQNILKIWLELNLKSLKFIQERSSIKCKNKPTSCVKSKNKVKYFQSKYKTKLLQKSLQRQ